MNMFNFFFDQKYTPPEGDISITVGVNYHSSQFNNEEEDKRRDAQIDIYTKYKTTSCFLCCNPFVYREPSFSKFRTIINGVMNRNLTLRFKPQKIPENTLGVHCRYMHHYTIDGKSTRMTAVMTLEDYYKRNIEQIRQEFESGNYRHMYVACNVKQYLDRVVKEFKDKALFLDYARWEDEIIDQNDCSSRGYSLALQDKMNLTTCDFLLGNVSNFTMTTLILNPHLKFKLFDTIKDYYGM